MEDRGDADDMCEKYKEIDEDFALSLFEDWIDHYVPVAFESMSEDSKDEMMEGFKVDFADF